MIMDYLLLTCQFLPLLGLLLIVCFGTTESRIARMSSLTTHALGISILGLLLVWAGEGFVSHEFLWFTIYRLGEYQFPVLFYFDTVGATYLFCTWVIFSIIVRYCRYYMHREEGFRRFFITIFAFVFGLNMVILSGLLDMLFAGWEIVGIASFLLIAFYRHRVQPIRNSLRAYTIYRFCDIGLLLGAWLSDLTLHGHNHFSHLAENYGAGLLMASGPIELFALSIFLLIAACGKSAQFPFCFWLPRAMEGPTPSSAIFYGSLSVHLGVFLLLRTEPIWTHEILTRAMVFLIGLLTVVVASLSEKTQSNIKGQIAYASITQVGFMFMELALGLEALVLVHFLGNAFLRCYQLLVSPSVVTHLLRVESATDGGIDIKNTAIARSLPLLIRDTLPEVLQNTLVVLSLQEFNLEAGVRRVLWDPLMKAGAMLNAIRPWLILLIAGLVAVGIWLGLERNWVPRPLLAIPVAIAMLMASISAFSQRRNAYRGWFSLGLSCFLAGISTWLASEDSVHDVLLFLSGIIPAWVLGFWLLRRMLRRENFREEPFIYRAMADRQPRLSLFFFLSVLGLVSFPITPAFLGQDLLLYHVSDHHPAIIVLIAVSFVMNGIAAASLYQRLCMGRSLDIAVPAWRI
jgi:formate hydrogenlyase subunit 3/multisubunit Na+/H+ antiporter MnhD subunit